MRNMGKYLSFDDLRVSYNHRKDEIILTSGDPELAADGWRYTLGTKTHAERVLRSKLLREGFVKTMTGAIPKLAALPVKDNHPWWEFPLGLGPGGKEICLDLRGHFGHAYIAGRAGGGKTVINRTILHHAANNMSRWDVLGIDLAHINMAEYGSNPLLSEFFTRITTLEAAVEALRAKVDLIHKRYTMMQELGLSSFNELVDKGQLRAQLIIIDEASLLFAYTGDKTPAGIAADKLRSEAVTLVGEIGRLGTSGAHVNLIVGTQNPTVNNMPGELRSNLTNRIVAGKLDSMASSLMLDSRDAVGLPDIKGRGMVLLDNIGESTEIQFYNTLKSDMNSVGL